jgi:ribosomal protein S18 acetylase RimI-like enzyme
MHSIHIRPVDYQRLADQQALCALLDHYAQDPMGGGTPLATQALARLCDDLSQRSFAFSFIAWAQTASGQEAVGLVNCLEGYSTFKAQPLVNIHDLVVQRDWRAQGVGQMLLARVAQEALARKACKITLEVLTGNTAAIKSYERFGFTPYALDPKAGVATLMQKWL